MKEKTRGERRYGINRRERKYNGLVGGVGERERKPEAKKARQKGRHAVKDKRKKIHTKA